jgi:hypothetical protein
MLSTIRLIAPCAAFALLWCALSGLTAAPAAAATFCLRQQGGQPDCLYEDASECRRRAFQINGLCSVNPDILLINPTNGKYCLVTSGRAVLCHYTDRDSCEQAAQRQSAVCIDSTQQGAQPDPHREVPGRQY